MARGSATTSLLRTYLVAALRRRDPGEMAVLRVIAATWFLEQRDPAEALELGVGGR